MITLFLVFLDKNNAPKVKDIKITPGDKPNTYKVTYTGPDSPEEFIITVTFGRQPVPKSPFKIKVTLKFDASKCKAYGPGKIFHYNLASLSYPPCLMFCKGGGALLVEIFTRDGLLLIGTYLNYGKRKLTQAI